MYKHVLVPTDGSKLSGKALASALEVAKLARARVTVLHVLARFNPVVFADGYTGVEAEWIDHYEKTARQQGRKHLERAAAAAKSAGVRCATKMVRSAQPHRAIISAARSLNCDLIVMASHGRSGLKALLLGSETSKVLTHCRRPVLVVR